MKIKKDGMKMDKVETVPNQTIKTEHNLTIDCNYSNNYYGDQVCLIINDKG